MPDPLDPDDLTAERARLLWLLGVDIEFKWEDHPWEEINRRYFPRSTKFSERYQYRVKRDNP